MMLVFILQDKKTGEIIDVYDLLFKAQYDKNQKDIETIIEIKEVK